MNIGFGLGGSQVSSYHPVGCGGPYTSSMDLGDCVWDQWLVIKQDSIAQACRHLGELSWSDQLGKLLKVLRSEGS